MPNRRYQGKELPDSEFITVDLLPDVKRPRQFNVNVILIVLVAVFFSWLLIYWPLSGRQAELDQTLENQNDYITLRDNLDNQVTEARIDRDVIAFSHLVGDVKALQSDYASLKADIMMTISLAEMNAEFTYFSYDVINETLIVRVSLPRQITFQNVRISLLEQDYIQSATYSTPHSPDGTSRYIATFTIGVDIDAF